MFHATKCPLVRDTAGELMATSTCTTAGGLGGPSGAAPTKPEVQFGFIFDVSGAFSFFSEQRAVDGSKVKKTQPFVLPQLLQHSAADVDGTGGCTSVLEPRYCIPGSRVQVLLLLPEGFVHGAGCVAEQTLPAFCWQPFGFIMLDTRYVAWLRVKPPPLSPLCALRSPCSPC